MQIVKKLVKLTTDADGVNGRAIPAHYTPTAYTPTQVAAEGTDKLSSHLKGINNAISAIGGSPYDIGENSFSAANNQATPASITGFAFANANVRSFEAQVYVSVDATSDLFEAFRLIGIQRGSDWVLAATSVGDATGFVFSITSAGQLQYINNSYAGFVSAKIKFKASTLQV